MQNTEYHVWKHDFADQLRFYLKTLFQIEFPHFDMSTMKQYGEVVLDGEDFCKRHKVGTTEDRPERTFLRWAYKIFQGGTDISIKHKPWNVVNMSRFNVINLSFNYVSNLLIGMQFFLEFITVTDDDVSIQPKIEFHKNFS